MTGLDPASSGGKSSEPLLAGISPPSQRRLATNTSWSCADDRALDAHEQVVERAVLEVILDPGAADPADPAVDDHDLAVVDVPEAAQVPAGRARRRSAALVAPAAGPHAPRTPESPPRVSLLVELPRAALGVGSLPVDDHAHGHAVPRLRDQHLREPVADDTRAGTRTG